MAAPRESDPLVTEICKLSSEELARFREAQEERIRVVMAKMAVLMQKSEDRRDAIALATLVSYARRFLESTDTPIQHQILLVGSRSETAQKMSSMQSNFPPSASERLTCGHDIMWVDARRNTEGSIVLGEIEGSAFRPRGKFPPIVWGTASKGPGCCTPMISRSTHPLPILEILADHTPIFVVRDTPYIPELALDPTDENFYKVLLNVFSNPSPNMHVQCLHEEVVRDILRVGPDDNVEELADQYGDEHPLVEFPFHAPEVPAQDP